MHSLTLALANLAAKKKKKKKRKERHAKNLLVTPPSPLAPDSWLTDEAAPDIVLIGQHSAR